MKLEPHHRTTYHEIESELLNLLRELNDEGRTISYTKTWNFYKYQATKDTETQQYRVAISYSYRSALELELISNDIDIILKEIKVGLKRS